MMSKAVFRTLKGFTLVEIIIAMLLSGILLSIAIKVITMVTSISFAEKRESDQVNEVLLLHTFMDESFTGSATVSDSGQSEISFIFGNERASSVNFGSEMIIIGTKDHTDTLRLKANNIKIEKLSHDTTLVEKLSFSVKAGDFDFPFSLIKEYHSWVLFRTDRKE